MDHFEPFPLNPFLRFLISVCGGDRVIGVCHAKHKNDELPSIKTLGPLLFA